MRTAAARMLLALASGLVLLCAAPTPDATAKQITVSIQATLRAAFHPAVDGVTCPMDDRGVCGVRYRGDGWFSRDLEGEVRFSGTEWVPLGRPSYADEQQIFTGKVERCGEGTFTIQAHPVDDGTVDLREGGVTGRETWHIVSGSSSSGLPGLAGSGTAEWVLRPDATVVAHYVGTIGCEATVAGRARRKRARGRRHCDGNGRERHRCGRFEPRSPRNGSSRSRGLLPFSY